MKGLGHGLAAIVAIVLLGGAAAHGPREGGSPVLTLTRDDNHRSVALKVGDVFEIRLPENATTGYRWAPNGFDPAVLELAGTAADYPRTGAVGAGGEAIFRFLVRGAGAAPLTFKYWRSWEGESSVGERFAVTIEATQ